MRSLRDSGLPVVFLPGVIHLPTVPAHRKRNRIDLGTADKLCVAALALAQHDRDEPALVAEFGSAFTALVVLKGRQIVDGLGGTCGPLGGQSGGAWDGETAYLLSPLRKADLFRGGAADGPDRDPAAFCESFVKAVAGLAHVHGFRDVYAGGALMRTHPDLTGAALAGLPGHGYRVHETSDLAGAWVKHAAQGAALVADGLCGGALAPLVGHLNLRGARGTVLDGLTLPRAAEVRAWFGERGA